MYNLTVGLKLKKGNYIDEECINNLSNICCYLIGNEKDKFTNCLNCGQNNISKKKMSCGKITLISHSCNTKCIMKESFMVGKDEIRLFINSSYYEVINKLVQELFKLESIHISQYEFEIYNIELISLDRIKEEKRKAKINEEPIKTYSMSLQDNELENLAYNL